MKHLLKTVAINAIFILFLPLITLAQSPIECYKMRSDVSGNKDTIGMGLLKRAACRVQSNLLAADQPKFKVHDAGMYILNENIKSNTNEPFLDLFEKLKKAVALENEFYIFTGRQSDGQGVYSKIFVAVKLPKITSNNCPDDFNEKAKKLLISKIEDFYKAKPKSYDQANYAIAQGLDALANYIKDVKICCQQGGNVEKCLMCQNTDNIYTTLVGKGFEKTKIQNIGNYPANATVVNIPEMEDNAKLLFTVNDRNVVDIPKDYIAVIDTVKKQGLTIKVFITKDADVCTPQWETITQAAQAATYDIVYWHHIHKGTGIGDTYLFAKTFYKVAPSFSDNSAGRGNVSEFVQLLEKEGSKLPNLMLNALQDYLQNDNIEICDYKGCIDKALAKTQPKEYLSALFKIKNTPELEKATSSSYVPLIKNASTNSNYSNREATRDFFYKMATRMTDGIIDANGLIQNFSKMDITKGLSDKGWEKLSILLFRPTMGVVVGEHPDIFAYQEHTGNKTITKDQFYLQKEAWFYTDRKEKNQHWRNCMAEITKNRWENRWVSYSYHEIPNDHFFIIKLQKDKLPFSIVNSYYLWVQHEMDKKFPRYLSPLPNTNDAPIKLDLGLSRWAVDASYLVSNLADSYVDGVTTGNIPPSLHATNDVRPILSDLNIGIANYAVQKFSDALYSNEVVEFYKWDRDFIRREQVTRVAFDVYLKYKDSPSLNDMDGIVRQTFPFGSLVSFVTRDYE